MKAESSSSLKDGVY